MGKAILDYQSNDPLSKDLVDFALEEEQTVQCDECEEEVDFEDTYTCELCGAIVCDECEIEGYHAHIDMMAPEGFYELSNDHDAY